MRDRSSPLKALDEEYELSVAQMSAQVMINKSDPEKF